MLTLLPDECRVLGVLVEKALTVPTGYPMTLNSLVLGANQKNNRDPLTNFDEENVLDALDGLRKKGLAVEVFLSGSRVAKYRHNAREKLAVSTEELALLTELMLRGPQSPGELRSRAGRMTQFESLEKVVELLEGLIKRTAVESAGGPPGPLDPLVRELPPSGRARRFGQLLCPDLHPLDHAAGSDRDDDAGDGHPAPSRPSPNAATAELTARIDALERQSAELRAAVRALAAKLGEPDPFIAP